MKRYIADLHIHTCLSPCAELDMTPVRIMERALGKGLDIVAIADHNSAENVAVAEDIARQRGLTLLPAMEITSSEEVHVLAIFGSVDGALRMQQVVYRHLDGEVGPERMWGQQVVVNERDEVLGFNRRLLVGATHLGLRAVVDEVHALGGLAIASHVDREAFGLIGQLGFVPEDVEMDAFEVTGHSPVEGYAHIPRVSSSDAHRLDDVGRRTTAFTLARASFEEVALALRGSEGREIECL